MINGLTKEQNAAIIEVVSRFEKLTRLVVFGSRAMGNHKHGSDIDLAVWGLEPSEVRELNICLNEYLGLPHRFDVVRFESVNNPGLKQYIIEFGKLVYPLEKITE